MYSLKKIPDFEIEEEIDNISKKPTAYANQGYPYKDMPSSREFEILIYLIFKLDIENQYFKDKYDDISLMVGVGERGRDCALHFQGKNVGLIQCKKYSTRITKPEVAREILKFVLHYLKDNTLITDIQNFTYYIVAAYDFNEEALELLRNFNQQISKEPNFDQWVETVIKDNKSLESFTLNTIKQPLIKVLNSIQVERRTATDIDLKLKQHEESLASRFFQVKVVVATNEIPELREHIDEQFKNLTQQQTKSVVNKFLPVKDALTLPMVPEHFVGRTTFIQEILEATKSNQCMVIIGLSGMGKSVLLARLVQEFDERVVFYYDFREGLTSLNDVLIKLAVFVDKQGDTTYTLSDKIDKLILNQQIQTAISELISNLNKTKYYLFFDSTEYVEGNESIISFFKLLKDKFHHGNIFVTGAKKPRFYTSFDISKGIVSEFELTGLSKPEIKLFFETKKLKVSKQIVDDLSEKFEGFPLTLDIISVLLSQSMSDEEVENILDEVKTHTFEHLFEKVYEKLSQPERDLLKTASIFNVFFSKEQLFGVHKELTDYTNETPYLLKRLTQYLLLNKYQFLSGYFNVHTVIRDLVRTYTNEINEKRIKTALYLVSEMATDLWVNLEAIMLCYQAKDFDLAVEIAIPVIDTGLIPYHPDFADEILNSFQETKISPQNWIWVLGSKGIVASYWQRYEEARNYYLNMLEDAKKLNDKDAIAIALMRLGILEYKCKNYDEAEQHYLESIDIKKETKNFIGQAQVYNNLSMLYFEQGKFKKVEEALNKGLDIHNEENSSEWDKLSIYGSLSLLHAEKQEWKQAIKFGQKVLDIAEDMNLPHEIATSTLNLGIFEYKQGNHKFANDYYQKSLKTAQDNQLWHVQELILSSLIKQCFDQGWHDEGIQYCQQAIKVQEIFDNKERLATLHFDLGTFYWNINCIPETVNQYVIGLNLFEHFKDKAQISIFLNNVYQFLLASKSSIVFVAIKELKKHLSQSQSQISYCLAKVYEILGNAYVNAFNKYRVGFACLNQSIFLFEKLDCLDEQKQTLINLGNAYLQANYYDEALSTYTKVINEVAVDTPPFVIIDTLFHRGRCFSILEQWVEAEKDYVKAIDFAEKYEVFQTYEGLQYNLGLACLHQGKYDEAIKAFEYALSVYKAKNDIDLQIETLNDIGLAYFNLSYREKGLEFYTEALNLSRQHSRKSLESSTLIKIGNCYFESDDFQQAKEFFKKALVSAREANDIHYEEGSILSLAHTHYQLGTFEEIQSEFEFVASRASELEHYENLMQFCSLAGRADFDAGDLESSAEMFGQSIVVALMSWFSKNPNLEDNVSLKDVPKVILELVKVIKQALDDGKLQEGTELYEKFCYWLKEQDYWSDISSTSLFIDPIGKYLEELPNQPIIDYVLLNWQEIDRE